MNRKNIIALLVLLVLFSAASCGRSSGTKAPEEGLFQIYYLDKTGTELYPVAHRAEKQENSREELIAEDRKSTRLNSSHQI